MYIDASHASPRNDRHAILRAFLEMPSTDSIAARAHMLTCCVYLISHHNIQCVLVSLRSVVRILRAACGDVPHRSETGLDLALTPGYFCFFTVLPSSRTLELLAPSLHISSIVLHQTPKRTYTRRRDIKSISPGSPVC